MAVKTSDLKEWGIVKKLNDMMCDELFGPEEFMTDDLVARLRAGTYDKSRAFDWMNAAADRIEQLEAELRSQINMRDHFAAQIACGMAAHSGTMGFSFGPESIAKRSYEVADRMLKVRTLPEGEVKDD